MKIKTIVTVLLLFSVCFALTAQVSYDGTVYSQNFDSLISDDNTSATYVDNTTISGWYVNSEEMDSNSDEYFAENGSSSSGEVFSFGLDGASDRALGYTGSGGNDYFNVAVRLVNDSGATITSLDVAYVGEQWRSGGNTNDNLNSLAFSYQVFASGAGSIPTSTNLTGWTSVGALEFSPPQPEALSGLLDGNLPLNSTDLTSNVSGFIWAPGEELWLRWTGGNAAGTDAGIGIDDFSVSPVPEPSVYSLLAGCFALASVMMRRRTIK